MKTKGIRTPQKGQHLGNPQNRMNSRENERLPYGFKGTRSIDLGSTNLVESPIQPRISASTRPRLGWSSCTFTAQQLEETKPRGSTPKQPCNVRRLRSEARASFGMSLISLLWLNDRGTWNPKSRSFERELLLRVNWLPPDAARPPVVEAWLPGAGSAGLGYMSEQP